MVREEPLFLEQDDARKIPVVVAIGEICDRPDIEVEGLDSIELMLAALREAEADLGVSVLDRLDWLGVEDQISFPNPAPHEDLAARLPRPPVRSVKTLEASGDGPLQLLNDAANLIGRGEIQLAAVVGGEALRTAAKRTQADIAAGRTPPASSITDVATALAKPLARKYGLSTPVDVYPLYENATRAAWGQTLAEGQQESAMIWSGFSAVAAGNPYAWMRQTMAPEEIGAVTASNRMVSFPYTKLMVANASVNMGAALIVTTLALAREMGVADERIVYIGAGAAAHEDEDFLKRDSYARSASLETTVTAALGRNGLTASEIDHVELYSCFPCIPKMARRLLDWPLERPASVYGGLTFGGGPIGNCMMHAAAQMVRKLRAGGTNGLIVANGGYATHSHSLLFTRRPVPAGTFPQDYDVQAEANARRGAVPALLEDYEGAGVIETFTIPFDRHGNPQHATIVARTPGGARFLAHVPPEDSAMLASLMADDRQPVGSFGEALKAGDKVVWRAHAS
jgi:acetyl-CoA C-acetyltransferase